MNPLDTLFTDIWLTISNNYLHRLDIVLFRLTCKYFHEFFPKPTFLNFWNRPRSLFNVALENRHYSTALIFLGYGAFRASEYEIRARYMRLVDNLFQYVFEDINISSKNIIDLYNKVPIKYNFPPTFWMDAIKRRFFNLLPYIPAMIRHSGLRDLLPMVKKGQLEGFILILDRHRLSPLTMTNAAGLIMPLIYAAAQYKQINILIFLGKAFPEVLASRNGNRRRKIREHFIRCHATPEMYAWLLMVFPMTRSMWKRMTKKVRKGNK